MRIPGPLFHFELVRSTRRGNHLRLRVLFALALLVGLFLVYLDHFPDRNALAIAFQLNATLTIPEMANFAESFAFAFLMVQMFAVVLLTPPWVAGAWIEEKQSRNLECLFTTELSDREIVLGKLAARLFQVGGVVLAGVPILCCSLLFGGVDTGRILAGYAGTAATMWSLGGVSFACAVRADTLGEAVGRTYAVLGVVCLAGIGGLLILPLSMGIIPPMFVLYLFDPPSGLTTEPTAILVSVYVFVHLLVGGTAVAWTITHIRGTPLPTMSPPPIAEEAEPSWATPIDLREGIELTLPPPSRAPRVDEDYPLRWKERWFGGPRPSQSGQWIEILYLPAKVLVIVLAIGGLIPCVVLGIPLLILDPEVGLALASLIVAIGGGLTLYYLGRVGSEVAGSITRERETRTLDSLRVLPVDRRDILAAKIWAALRRPKPWALGVVGCLLLGGVLSGPFGWFKIVTTLAVSLALVALGVSFAMWLSVRCQGTTRAVSFWWVGLLAICLMPLGIPPIAESIATFSGEPKPNVGELNLSEVLHSVSPWRAWLLAAFTTEQSKRVDALAPEDAYALAWVAVPIWGSLSVILWWLARRQFDREGYSWASVS